MPPAQEYEALHDSDDTIVASPSSSKDVGDESRETMRFDSYEDDEGSIPETGALGKSQSNDLEDLEHEDAYHSETEHSLDFTDVEEKKVLKKLDRRVVLFVALLYLLSFLDRSNIGNARIAGLEKDLKLTSEQYEWLLTAFYISYILFEWMALLFRIIPPHIYLATCVMAWGILASLQSISNSFASLLVFRALLGVSEAAFAGVPFYLSLFYRNEELASRVGIFISAAPLATTFASSLAWLITWIGEKTQIWAPWRLLFLVEGFPSVLVAYWVWNSLPDGPREARFLTVREKHIATSRLQEGTSGQVGTNEKLANTHNPKLNIQEIIAALKDPKCYLTAMMFFSINVAFSSMPVFLPTIIKEMGCSSSMAQALSAPPYLLAFVVVIFVSRASDRAKVRSPFIMLMASLACTGYLFICFAGLVGLPSWIRYLGVYPATAGFFTCVTLIITWTLNNQKSDSKKGTGFAMLQYFGQCGPLLGTRLYPKTEGPLYLKGMAVCAGFMALVGILALFLRRRLQRENLAMIVELRGLEGGEEDVELLARDQRNMWSRPVAYLL